MTHRGRKSTGVLLEEIEEATFLEQFYAATEATVDTRLSIDLLSLKASQVY